MSSIRPLLQLTIHALALLLAAAPAGAGELTLGGSLAYATGDYGLVETTRTWTLLNELSYRAGPWSLLVSLPVYHQGSSALLHAGGVHLPRGRGGDGSEAGDGRIGQGGKAHRPGHGGGSDPPPDGAAGGDETGLGDPVLRLDFTLPGYLPGGIAGGLFAAVKAPVADADSGFGTEEWDYGAGLVAWRSGPELGASLELAWWRLGDPAALELKDPLTYRLAVARALPRRRLAVAGLLRGYTETIPGRGSSAEVGVTLSRTFGAGRSLGLTALVGLTDAAPDLSFAVGWRFGRRIDWRVEGP